MAVTNRQLIVVEVTTSQKTPVPTEMANDIMAVLVKGALPGWVISFDSAWVDVKRRYEIVQR